MRPLSPSLASDSSSTPLRATNGASTLAFSHLLRLPDLPLIEYYTLEQSQFNLGSNIPLTRTCDLPLILIA
jgi:hypothetical protein